MPKIRHNAFGGRAPPDPLAEMGLNSREILHEMWLFDCQENHYICCNQLSEYSGLKCTKFYFQTPLGELTALPKPLTEFKESTSKGMGGKGRKRKEQEGERERGGGRGNGKVLVSQILLCGCAPVCMTLPTSLLFLADYLYHFFSQSTRGLATMCRINLCFSLHYITVYEFLEMALVTVFMAV